MAVTSRALTISWWKVHLMNCGHSPISLVQNDVSVKQYLGRHSHRRQHGNNVGRADACEAAAHCRAARRGRSQSGTGDPEINAIMCICQDKQVTSCQLPAEQPSGHETELQHAACMPAMLWHIKQRK